VTDQFGAISGPAVAVLLVGKSSQLARAVLETASAAIAVHAVSHDTDWNAIHFDDFDVVVNMAYDPRYMREPYDEAKDFDLWVARKTDAARPHFVMLSTRRVYGPNAPFPANESTVPAPADHYGRNKLATEIAVKQLLGPRCTILRVANVFGFEPGHHTFFGIVLKSLKERGQIVLDVAPTVRRDFIYIEDFARIVRALLANPPGGTLNIGSGVATELGSIARAVIEGYGEGQLVVESEQERDNFLLDVSRLESVIGPTSASAGILQRCREIGARLRNE
jgi:UDP-glucose 4-epimerase